MSLQSDHISSDVSQLNSLSDDLSQSVLPSGDVNVVSSTDNNATDPITAPCEDAVSVVQQVQDTDAKQIAVSSADLDSGDVAGTPSIGSSFVKVGLSSEESECKEEPANKDTNNAPPAENGDTVESSEPTHQVEEITADGLTTENENNPTEVKDQKSDENVDTPPSQTTESCETLEAPSQVCVDDTSLHQEESFEQIPDDSLDGSEVPTVDEPLQSITSQSLGSFQQVESLAEDSFSSFSIIEQSLDNQPNKQQNDGESAEIPLKEGTVENIESVQVIEEVNKTPVESVEPVQATQEVNQTSVESVEPVQATQEVNQTSVESVEPVQATQEVNQTSVESVEPVQATQEVNQTSVESVEPVQATQEVNHTSVESAEPVQVTQEVSEKAALNVEPVQTTEEVNKPPVVIIKHNQVTKETNEKTVENVEQTPVTEEVNKTLEGKTEEKETEEDEWLDILGNELLKKKVVVKGLGPDSRPERGQEVTIQYESSKEDGSVYESKESFTFIIADGDVCEALDLSVNLMQKGESCTVVSDVKYCWNKNDVTRPSSLPQSGTLTYTIQLKTVEDGPYNTSVDIEHRLKWAENKKQQGNYFYGRKNFESSVVSYKKCLNVLKQALNQENIDEKVQARVRELAVKCYNNVAASHLQLAEWGRAVTACTDAEALDSNNVKTLLRKGKALSQLGKDSDAVGVLKKAAKIDPNAKDVQSELVRVTKKMTAQKEAQKKMCERMFGGGQTNKKVEEEEPPSSSIFSWKSPFVYGSSAMMLAAVIIGLFMYQKQ